MDQANKDSGTESVKNLQELLSGSLEALSGKIKALITNLKKAQNENISLKENIRELNLKLSELKLQLNKLNSESVQRDKEISDLKNLLLDTSNNKISVQDKEKVRSRIKELISRIDVHLSQYD